MAYLLIIAGLISLMSGIFLLSKKEKPVLSTVHPQEMEADTNIVIASTSEKKANAVGEIVKSEKKSNEIDDMNQTAKSGNGVVATEVNKVADTADDSKKKGDAFEQYVVKRFDRKYFKIKEWRGDKYVDGIYADSNRDPDLEISFNWKGQDDLFAVECKWRKDSYKGKLEWAESYQLSQYQKFKKSRNIPVFIIIGVGGSPEDPKYVYVIPLQDVNSHILENADIKQYLKTDDRGFYWDKENKSLS